MKKETIILWETLIKMHCGEIPMTEEGKQQLEQLKEFIESLPATESVKRNSQHYKMNVEPWIYILSLFIESAKIKEMTNEVYEDLESFYFKEWGLRVRNEEYSWWFFCRYRFHRPNVQVKRVNATYTNISDTFNKFYAESRIKRERAQNDFYSALKIKNSSKDSEQKKENLFNNMSLELVEKWFIKLAANKSTNGYPFLSTSDVELFIKRAFCKNSDIEKLTLNFGPKEKLFVWRLFYQYYLNCISIEDGVERGIQCRDKYIRLLTENFTNFTFEEVKANFAKSNSIGQEWN